MRALAPRLELRQSQSLVMTQQLQQSIKLLQLSSQELQEFIEQELEKNPLLTLEEQEPREEDTIGDEEKLAENPPSEENDEDTSQEMQAESAEDWQEESTSESFDPPSPSALNDENSDHFESFTAKAVTLREYLLEQLYVEVTDPIKRIVGQHLIDLVDESGYIREDTSAIAALLECEEALIETTLALLHNFDPPGVCARTVAECLRIQLRDKNRLDPAIETLLEHLHLVAISDHAALQKICEVDEQDIRDMCAEIRALNPRPGQGFEQEAAQTITPDVFLRRAQGGGWHVELNAGALPRVLVNRRYYAELSRGVRDKQDKKYFSDQLALANWLVKALDQRAQTILKVATEIVAQQDGFFRQGITHLRPLTLKEVALAVNLHESTVSRVTSNKYMATPRGTYELKYFFNASIQNASGGEDYSNKTVQHIIKEIIDQESCDAILSDDVIANTCQNRGIDIARRTVAKYRELMRIPSSAARRRQKMGQTATYG